MEEGQFRLCRLSLEGKHAYLTIVPRAFVLAFLLALVLMVGGLVGGVA